MRACVLGVVLAAFGTTGLIAGTTGAVQGPLVSALTSYEAWLVVLAGGAFDRDESAGCSSAGGLRADRALAKFIYRAMQVGVLLLAAGTILGGAWAQYVWDGFWGLEPKLVWALITLLVYLVPLHGRYVGWINTFGLVAASVLCFMAVLTSWYGLNFVLRVGLHNYGFTEGGGRRIVMACTLALPAVVGAAAWRQSRSQ